MTFLPLRSCLVTQSVLRLSRGFQHQFDLRNCSQQLRKLGTGHLRTVLQLEAGTGGRDVVVQRFRRLENEGFAEAIEKPLGVADAIDSHSAGTTQRTYPYLKKDSLFYSKRKPLTDAVGPVADWPGTFDNNGPPEAIDKPVGIVDAIDRYPKKTSRNGPCHIP